MRVDGFLGAEDGEVDVGLDFEKFRGLYADVSTLAPYESYMNENKKSCKDFTDALGVKVPDSSCVVYLCIADTETVRRIILGGKRLEIGQVMLCTVRGGDISRLYKCTGCKVNMVYLRRRQIDCFGKNRLQTLVRRENDGKILRFYDEQFWFEFDTTAVF
jgi:hypothetical protein